MTSRIGILFRASLYGRGPAFLRGLALLAEVIFIRVYMRRASPATRAEVVYQIIFLRVRNRGFVSFASMFLKYNRNIDEYIV